MFFYAGERSRDEFFLLPNDYLFDMCLLQRGETLKNRTRSAACGIYLDIDLSDKRLAF
jgi:hypothetical protein